MTTRRPSDKSLLETLRFVGSLLGTTAAGVYEGRFYFRLDGRWSVAISPDSAGRFRVDVCVGAAPRATMWARAGDTDRLADLVLSARDEVLALA
jgi:hypothetical protein